ncbi:hypothetical protein BDF20DRAFT_911996 [Mycotypha africana]|uniref:uncharacterized protein n=1 Tax=Mycotypha africana TaxID=64632 RepID=UPI00230199BC|nr:uncharacterized protein BDF20DRAFT_911996 [Mycotypha africana]KAI8981741.1 hypothetical protein BDF20DRAFT_911996 [Mycotypha africana]
MRYLELFFCLALAVAVSAAQSLPSQQPSSLCSPSATEYFKDEINYSLTLQQMIDEAESLQNPVVYLPPGIFTLDPATPIILKRGVSLKGDPNMPSILSVRTGINDTGSIEVSEDNGSWSIEDIVFDNVNIIVAENQNEDNAAVLGNLFFNGGRGSVIAKNGGNLLIDGNIFLRDEPHAGTELIPNYNTTNTGILFHTQKNSIISNNIFGMDLRKLDELEPVINPQLARPMRNLRFMHECLNKFDLADEQGYIASGIQMYSTLDITIAQNILNATFPDTKPIAQDHGISVVGCNRTNILQNFFAGWQVGDFGGGVRFTSTVDAYVISNYFANAGVYMYAAAHADYLQVSNIVVYNNFLYKFLGEDVAPVAEEQKGWLYEGITFFDFYTARLNYTIRPPIWNESVPISPLGSHIVISSNKFGAVENLAPDIINLGNLNPQEAFVDPKNCYVTEPFNEEDEDEQRLVHSVPIVWRQLFHKDRTTKFGSFVPQKTVDYVTSDLHNQIPPHWRQLPIPQFWKGFTLRNDTVPMFNPDTACTRNAAPLA